MTNKFLTGFAITLILVGVAIALGGCEQQLAKHGFGEMTVEIPCDYELVNATWKNEDLWYITRPMEGDPVTSVFQSKTVLGIFEGKVTFKESVCRS